MSKYRAKRGERLSALIRAISARIGRALDILDVGGRPSYWRHVDLTGVRSIRFINVADTEMEGTLPDVACENLVGDARNLSDHGDKSVDLVHSNSVLEHVGGWSDMRAMANEVRRVGRAGWVQTPAVEFPFEPHHRLPCVHWLGLSARARALQLHPRWRNRDIDERRRLVEGVNLVSRREFTDLFPGSPLYVERVYALPKSYVAWWAE